MAAQRTHRVGSFIACLGFVWPVILTNVANAITIRVPQNYKIIQEAIDCATDGDEIVVSLALCMRRTLVCGGKTSFCEASIQATLPQLRGRSLMATIRTV